MTPFLISFGAITTLAAVIWFIYVFLKEDIITYMGFNGLRRKFFRRKLKNKAYTKDSDLSTDGISSRINKASESLVENLGDETVILTAENDETVLLDGSDETRLL